MTHLSKYLKTFKENILHIISALKSLLKFTLK